MAESIEKLLGYQIKMLRDMNTANRYKVSNYSAFFINTRCVTPKRLTSLVIKQQILSETHFKDSGCVSFENLKMKIEHWQTV